MLKIIVECCKNVWTQQETGKGKTTYQKLLIKQVLFGNKKQEWYGIEIEIMDIRKDRKKAQEAYF